MRPLASFTGRLANGPAAHPPRPAPDFACPERRRGRGRLEPRVSRVV